VTAEAPLELVIVSGLSGAGRNTAASCLEDLGWYVVDNMPPTLLGTLADLGTRTLGGVPRIAAVVDVRSRAFSADVRAALDTLEGRGLHPRVIFLEASDDVLVRRFDSERRPHPLQGDGRLIDGITQERELLRDLRGEADLVVDSSVLNVHELRAKIGAMFGGGAEPPLHATVVSFGYKYGLPVDADLVVDCRFMPNPHWVPELRAHTGLDREVREHVMAQPGVPEFLDSYETVLRQIADGYRREGKHYLTLAVGCTGGKHRSVVIADKLAARLVAAGADVSVVHRDLGRE
jgi:UPF0042 nucleotide-binding protein